MKIIVSTKNFASFLNRAMIGEHYHITIDGDHLQIRDCQVQTPYRMNVEHKFELTPFYVKHIRLSKLKRFLKLLPEQPIVIEFTDNEEIICAQFVTSF